MSDFSEERAELDALRTDLWRVMRALNDLIEMFAWNGKVDFDALRRADDELRGVGGFDFLPPFGLQPDYRTPSRHWSRFADRRSRGTPATSKLYREQEKARSLLAQPKGEK